MALSNLAGWAEDKAASACGAACGASDKPEEKPAALSFWVTARGNIRRKNRARKTGAGS